MAALSQTRTGDQGWRSGEGGDQRHMWVELVVGSFLCSGFRLSSKTNISKFQFGQESGRRSTTMWNSTSNLLFIYLTANSWGRVLGFFFAGYVPLASLSPYLIIIFSEASYRPHLSHFWVNV